MKKAGYSGTPLAKKLGIKENFKVRIINAPDYYFDLFSDWPSTITIVNDNKSKKDFIHFFAFSAAGLEKEIVSLKNQLEQNGALWVSWYKKSAKIPTDLTDEVVRGIALANGLVDVKVCAVDEVWSVLKLVIPVKDREG